MNVILFSQDDRVEDSRIALRDARLQHLLSVHQAAPGDTVRVGEIGGLLGEAVVIDVDSEHAILDVSLDENPPPKAPLSLVLALPRPKMLRRILQSATECGLADIHLINSYRVEKSYWQSPLLAPEALRTYLLKGLSQSRDTVLPTVSLHRRFKPFVEDLLPGMLAGKRALLAQPGEHPTCPIQVSGESLLVVGPEGGFIPYEVLRLQEAGCEAVSLGPRILRVETAVSALLGRLALG